MTVRQPWGAQAALIALSIGGVIGQARAEPLSTLAELSRVIGSCLRRADLPRESAGSEITVSFSLRRDGRLLGKPRVTYSRLTGGPVAERAFVLAALTGVERCLPLDLSPGLGGAVAGRLLRFRITAPAAPAAPALSL